MKQKFPCKKCKKNYRSLTKDGLCAYCHKEETGEWAKEFSYNVGDKTKTKEIKK